MRLITRHKDRKVVKDDPPYFLGQCHEPAVTEDTVGVNTTKPITQVYLTSTKTSIKGILKILLR